ncbi:MAG: hypothetical protein M3O50_17990 [Myxococcota bacterium]|nr:hypothetical protein [Myxococcota bacterium]
MPPGSDLARLPVAPGRRPPRASSPQLAGQDAMRASTRGPSSPLELSLNVLYNPEQRSAVIIVPGLVGGILSLTMLMLTSMALVWDAPSRARAGHVRAGRGRK